MNSIKTTFRNSQGGVKLQEDFDIGEKFFQNLDAREKNFIKNNIYSFECYFATKPEMAIQSFLFPVSFENAKGREQWNSGIEKILKNFSNISEEHKDIFLENFYEKILTLTESEPSDSMKTRIIMRHIAHQYL